MEQLQHLKKRKSTARDLFRGPQATDELEFLPEEEQEELIESLRISNDRANSSFKLVLLAFSVMEFFIHIAFSVYRWYQSSSQYPHYPDSQDPSIVFRQSASPATATLFSLISFGIGIFIIKDTTRIARDSLAVWTFVSVTPLLLMAGATDFSFELLWWSMPLMLQVVDLTSLWIMQDPDEAFFKLEKSQYKLKGA
ncbi:hypothetical protein BGZ72_008617 [Mortierella alpina]|nr:hypothetical protein BGZ72_008617 [Mortierella alpina]